MSDRAAALWAALDDEQCHERACAVCDRRLRDAVRSDGGRPSEREVVLVRREDARAVCCGACYRRVVEKTGVRPRRVFKTGSRRRVTLGPRGRE